MKKAAHTPRDKDKAEATSVRDQHQPTTIVKTVENDRKVSASWRWDVLSQDVSQTNSAQVFQRTGDFSAYHALPIARAELGILSERKTIRLHIQKMIDEMPDSEYQKWVESLRKLHDGDETMLARATQDEAQSTTERRISAVTAAPIDARISRCQHVESTLTSSSVLQNSHSATESAFFSILLSRPRVSQHSPLSQMRMSNSQ